MAKKIEGDRKKDKDFVMPNSYCSGCKKLLRLKPMTLYVKCGLCDTISIIIRKNGGYITAPYLSKEPLRDSILDNEQPTEIELYLKHLVDNDVKLRMNVQFLTGMAKLKTSIFAMIVEEEVNKLMDGDQGINTPRPENIIESIKKDDLPERIKKIGIKLLPSPDPNGGKPYS